MKTPLDAAIDAAVKPMPGAFVVRAGEVELVDGLPLKVFVLSDGSRLVDAESVGRFLDWLTGELDGGE